MGKTKRCATATEAKYLIELLTNETYTGITLINNSIYFNVNHFYESPGKKATYQFWN